MRRLACCSALAVLAGLASPAWGQDGAPQAADDTEAASDAAASDDEYVEEGSGGGTDILSGDTLTIQAQGSLVAANGERSFADGGFGKSRFDGNRHGELQPEIAPTELDLIWQPRFSRSLNGNVSIAWQNDQEHAVDVLEGYLTFIPKRGGTFDIAFKAGLYWPEISLEHATGGAWSTVYTITPSAINSWVGEEVKVIGAEATVHLALGSQDISLTGAAFGFNDTSGTLLSFRGWALHDLKATAFGHFELPPLNDFLTVPRVRQAPETRSLYEIDDRVGFYGRLEWRPATPVVLNAFYYDNRGDPEAFTHSLQWGWRTRFWNFGLLADLSQDTRFIAQGMTGTTKMGFSVGNVTWIDTRFSSVFGLLTHNVGDGAVSARGEWFQTKERGSRMSHADESEDGWAATAALRWPLWKRFTGFIEVLHVESTRGARARLGQPAKEVQTVLQAALRLRW